MKKIFALILLFILFVGAASANKQDFTYAYQPQFNLKFEIYRVEGLPERIFRTFDGYFVTRTLRGIWVYAYPKDDQFVETQIFVGSVDPRGIAILNRPSTDKYSPPDGKQGEFFSTVYPKDNFSVGTLVHGAKTVEPIAPYYAEIMGDSGILFEIVTAVNGPIVKVVDPRLAGANIKVGDIVTETNGRSVAGKEPEWVKNFIDTRLDSGKSVVLTFLRNGQTLVTLLKPTFSKELHAKNDAQKIKPFSNGETWGENEEKRSFESKIYTSLRKMNEYVDINLAYKLERRKLSIGRGYVSSSWGYGGNTYPLFIFTNGNKITFSSTHTRWSTMKDMLYAFDSQARSFKQFFGTPPTQQDSGHAVWRLSTGETFVVDTSSKPVRITYSLYPDYDIEVIESSSNFLRDNLR